MSLKSLPLILTTIVFLGVFASTVISLQLEDIRGNWDKRRCETMVISMAHLVPDGKDPNVDPTKFATDNFYFCMNKLVDNSMSKTINPLTGAINMQIDLANPIAQSMNYLRSNAKSLLDPLNKMVQSLWDSAKVIAIKISTTFYLIASAFHRAQALVLSTVFAGFAVFKGILNLLALVRRIVAEMMAMLMAIIIILTIISIFLPMLVSGILPILIAVVASIAASIAQDAYNELADVNSAIGFQDMPKNPGLREGLPPAR
jgi:hypothetical protein